MRGLLLFLCSMAPLSLGCGGSVETTNEASAAATGVGGGSSVATSASSVAASASSTSGAGGGACSGYLDVAADDGAPHHYGSICTGTWGDSETTAAVGYLFSGGPPTGGSALRLNGCLGPGANSEGLYLAAGDAMGPGTYSTGDAQWVDPGGGYWLQPVGAFEVVVTTLQGVGGAIEGTFSVQVSQGGDVAHMLSGSFHVCRVKDEIVP